MDLFYVLINVILVAFIAVLAARLRRSRKRKDSEHVEEIERLTEYRKQPRNRYIIPMYQPPHFDGARYRVENALDRDGIRLLITRNRIHSVNRPSDRELV